ncbi:hypothetical protein I4U23_015501 [Adineta vaga]|nr:hypothetical protein I4U23_015501 [Adineta vaga]
MFLSSLGSGLKELYKSHTFIIDLCQVTSIGVNKTIVMSYPSWNITVWHENETKTDSFMASNGYFTEERARSEANLYKIYQTYPCYRAKKDISTVQWKWQWKKPSKWLASLYLLHGISLLTTAISIQMLRERFGQELQTEQQPTAISLNVFNVEFNSASTNDLFRALSIIQEINRYVLVILYVIGTCGAWLNIITFLQKQLRVLPWAMLALHYPIAYDVL